MKFRLVQDRLTVSEPVSASSAFEAIKMFRVFNKKVYRDGILVMPTIGDLQMEVLESDGSGGMVPVWRRC